MSRYDEIVAAFEDTTDDDISETLHLYRRDAEKELRRFVAGFIEYLGCESWHFANPEDQDAKKAESPSITPNGTRAYQEAATTTAFWCSIHLGTTATALLPYPWGTRS
ncbi:hypothetical protein [Sorangium sp. So ce406]|uniref:hypothetical protein n=1 Tax=Sorangium sp. So ce406 TaxID=3133311 RepID=UPI003F5BD423